MNSKKTQFVKNLAPKDDVNSIFAVKYINLAQGRDGKSYLNLILSDATGDIETRMWANASKVASHISRGDFVQAAGKINLYQNRKQFVISKIERLAEESVDLSDFTIKSEFDPEKMYGDLLAIVERLDDVYIKDLLGLILNDSTIKERLHFWSAGKTIHHAYQSGLLEHILSCATLAESLSAHYQVNKNFVVAGAIIHDLCKVFELTSGVSVEYTDEGKMVGHLVGAVELVERFSVKIENFPRDTKMHLKHIVISHHGEFEYGSPKIPQTSEAFLVSLIDLMDSKMNTIETIKQNDTLDGNWSNYIRHLDRIIYKPDLPKYSEYVTESSEPPKVKTKPAGNKPIKTNMGSLLKDFKVE